MTKTLSWLLLIIPGVLAVLSGAAISAQDKYTLQVDQGARAFGAPLRGGHRCRLPGQKRTFGIDVSMSANDP